MDSTKIVNIFLAIFLPPVAVFSARGFGTECILSIILTICAWFPGMLYALYVVLTD
ncbi:uncharacterized protein GVI51_M08503 [Nakaseomyces glabratus]|uniref:Plasma membrane proteolipid 3 n=1 Tax=Candida glabrata (strain ATCC 2001 / BCRC 20586 / JCM 3761 / NBRC 0622 / NRRL Y-65 / CBS 138) TaxID=284593 RepID=B4UN60_CANGA|nr:uncharacterized protein CAGL0M08552g [Nakaseomyces glabratus]KAH7579031.1 Proteolipid membrane potential modulator [Nakaseomyces glabratus]KAH7579653.1 Proteolipid membrane potential modulator [Nakaseomyces glabratus]KAH7580278.1 Proteolipid membrane potential modulator [Nakaseomyces glabratus]KAH7592833.1 Proteolipid membrane potential modulator [Nakaseomyces glabratus]KAH7593904.1 Proteolipid membrane potential modulator [Nakaseomyces glabratus]|eukprot:XP_002999603.1 uncharacterized protein CAGL0M08552g [[Candida] glabrata]